MQPNLLSRKRTHKKVKLPLAYQGFVLVSVYDFFCFSIMVMVKAKDGLGLGVLSCAPIKAKPL